MMFPGIRAKLKSKINEPTPLEPNKLKMENMAGQLVGWLLPGQPVGHLQAWTVVQFACWLTAQLLAGEPVGLPAGCCGRQAGLAAAMHVFFRACFFPGSGCFGHSFTKMTYAGANKKSGIFWGLD